VSGHTPEVSRTLLARARAGDQEALRALVEHAYPLVQRWSLVHLGDPADADDLTQDVLVRMLEKLDTFGGRSEFGTWLYAMTKNAATDRVRGTARRERLTGHARAYDALLPAPTQDPSRLAERSELRRLLEAFFHELPDRQREVFDLVELEGLSSSEAAARMGLEPVSVRAHLFKARRTLRALILEARPELVEDLG
jgi:RNA polymerase sigma-70 factor (ECF subfamily)